MEIVEKENKQVIRQRVFRILSACSASEFLSTIQVVGQSGCPSMGTCSREEPLHGEDESNSKLTFTGEACQIRWKKFHKFFFYNLENSFSV